MPQMRIRRKHGHVLLHLPRTDAVLADSHVHPVEPRNAAAEARRTCSDLSQVSYFSFADEDVGDGFEVGVNAHDDVEGIGVGVKGAEIFSGSDEEFVGESFAAWGALGDVFVLELVG